MGRGPLGPLRPLGREAWGVGWRALGVGLRVGVVWGAGPGVEARRGWGVRRGGVGALGCCVLGEGYWLWSKSGVEP